MLRLILTDFCCWIPICILAFCRLGGVDINDTAYAVAAIVLLPINSALNPLLYSDLPETLARKCCVRWRRGRPATSTKQTIITTTNSSKGEGEFNQGFDIIGAKVDVNSEEKIQENALWLLHGVNIPRMLSTTIIQLQTGKANPSIIIKADL